MMLQKSWIRCAAVAMIFGVAGLATASHVHFSSAIALPGIAANGVPDLALGTAVGTLKGHVHTRSGKVHAIARGTVQNKSGKRFESEDTAAIAAFVPGSILGKPVTLKRADYSVSRRGSALFKGTLQVN